MKKIFILLICHICCGSFVFSLAPTSLDNLFPGRAGSAKSEIDAMVEACPEDEKIRVVLQIDNEIRQKGFTDVSPQKRYAYFKILTYGNVLERTVRDLNGISDNSRKALTVLLSDAPDKKGREYNFSRVALAVFSGMVEDGSFSEVCDKLQNGNFKPLPGAPNVLLVSSPIKERQVAIGLCRIASFLSLFGIHVQIICVNENIETPRIQIDRTPHLIGKQFITYELQNDLSMLNALHDHFPDSLYVGGGHEASFSDRVFQMDPDLDVLVTGWGEFAMLDMVMQINLEGGMVDHQTKERSLQGIENIRLRHRNQPKRHAYTNLDFRVITQAFNPGVVRDTFGGNVLLMHVQSTFGCPWNCSFCQADAGFRGSETTGQKICKVPPEDIAGVLKRSKKYLPGLRQIDFADDDPFSDTSFLDRLFTLIEQDPDLRGHFTYRCDARLDSLDRCPEELLKKMVGLGLIEMRIGLESTLEPVVRSLNKGRPVYAKMSRYREILNKPLRCGVRYVYAFIILCTLDITIEEVVRVVEDLISLMVSDGICPITTLSLGVYPGTQLWDYVVKNGIKVIGDTIETGDIVAQIPEVVIPRNPKTAVLHSKFNDASDKLKQGPEGRVYDHMMGEIQGHSGDFNESDYWNSMMSEFCFLQTVLMTILDNRLLDKNGLNHITHLLHELQTKRNILFHDRMARAAKSALVIVPERGDSCNRGA